MIYIYSTQFSEEWPAELWRSHFSKLPLAFHEDFLRYRRWQDRQSALLGKLLLNLALQRSGYDTNGFSKLLYTRYKRPYLDIPVDFNISHSGNLVVCALTDKGNIGIDVEEIKAVDFHQFNDIMSTEQWDEINNAENTLAHFYHYWTLKESVIKADGRGLGIPLQSLVKTGNNLLIENKAWHIKELSFDESFAAHLAYDEAQEIKIEPVNF